VDSDAEIGHGDPEVVQCRAAPQYLVAAVLAGHR
jgi:hypothetical protein